MRPLTNLSLGGIHFEKNRYYNFKIHRLFSGMGNIGFYIAVIIFKGTSYMEIMGRNYTSIGNSSFYSHLLACRKEKCKVAFIRQSSKGNGIGSNRRNCMVSYPCFGNVCSKNYPC